MAPKHHSRTLNSYLSEDNSDSEYKIEEESSEESEEKSDSKRIRRQSKNNRRVLEWQEKDEIIVLQQLYEFAGSNASYSKAFYEFVKKRLSSNNKVSMNQMSNKIERFKKEYLENECGRKENDLKFWEYHEFEVFMLSKRIWGAKRSTSNGGGMKYAKGFLEYLQEMDIDIDCLTPSCLEHFKKEWEVQLLMYIELLCKKSKFDAKLMELLFTKCSPP